MKKTIAYGDGKSAPALAHKYSDYTFLTYEGETRTPRLYDRSLSDANYVEITVCDFSYLHNLYMIYIVDSTTYTNTRYT